MRQYVRRSEFKACWAQSMESFCCRSWYIIAVKASSPDIVQSSFFANYLVDVQRYGPRGDDSGSKSRDVCDASPSRVYCRSNESAAGAASRSLCVPPANPDNLKATRLSLACEFASADTADDHHFHHFYFFSSSPLSPHPRPRPTYSRHSQRCLER